jgi:predicted site-specific integrase-resolvase
MASQNISYIPLEQAARKYGVSKNVLRQRVESGRLEVIETVNGDLLVADHNVDLSLNIKREDFEHLRGHGIGVREAAKKYEVDVGTLSGWIKAGHIQTITKNYKRGQKKLIDEADIAYCAAVYKEKYNFYNGRLSGVRIFDAQGNPYRLKYPEVAAQMRLERRKERQ